MKVLLQLLLDVDASSIAENSGSNLTLTATLSGATDEDITVALDTSGTATEGTDYTDGSSNIDDITISAGNTTGTVTFNPTNDSVCEIGNETAIIAINGVTGKTGVAENSTPQAVTITITEQNFMNCGTQLTYNPSTASSVASDTEFINIGFDNGSNGLGGDGTAISSVTPLVYHNFHKVAGYGLDGSGKTVHVMDSSFNSSHSELSGVTITTTGSTITASIANGYHGAFVTGIIASQDNGNLFRGAPPGVNLHLTDYAYNFAPSAWDDLYDGARTAGAVVSNNSWGFDEQYDTVDDISSVVNYKNNNSVTGEAALVHFQSQDGDGDGRYTVGAGTSVKNCLPLIGPR